MVTSAMEITLSEILDINGGQRDLRIQFLLKMADTLDFFLFPTHHIFSLLCIAAFLMFPCNSVFSVCIGDGRLFLQPLFTTK